MKMRVETKEAAEEAYNKMMNDVHPGQPHYFGGHSDDYDDYGDEYNDGSGDFDYRDSNE